MPRNSNDTRHRVVCPQCRKCRRVADTTYRDMQRAVAAGKPYRCKGCVAAGSRGPDAEHAKKIEELRRLVVDPADTPTTHLPGTADKIEVMKRRFDAKQHIHHDDDPKGAILTNFREWLEALRAVMTEQAERRLTTRKG